MRFEEVYFGWSESRLSQEEAARVLGVCDRTFRRYVNRYEEMGVEGLSDKRLTQASFRRAPVDEVMALMGRYESRSRGWNVKHFYSWYRRDGGQRSYSWVKNTLQSSLLHEAACFNISFTIIQIIVHLRLRSPISRMISFRCSSKRGARNRTLPGVRENFTGIPMVRISPSDG